MNSGDAFKKAKLKTTTGTTKKLAFTKKIKVLSKSLTKIIGAQYLVIHITLIATLTSNIYVTDLIA